MQFFHGHLVVRLAHRQLGLHSVDWLLHHFEIGDAGDGGMTREMMTYCLCLRVLRVALGG